MTNRVSCVKDPSPPRQKPSPWTVILYVTHSQLWLLHKLSVPGLRETVWKRKCKRSHQFCIFAAAESIMLEFYERVLQYVRNTLSNTDNVFRSDTFQIQIRLFKCQFDHFRPTVSWKRKQWKRWKQSIVDRFPPPRSFPTSAKCATVRIIAQQPDVKLHLNSEYTGTVPFCPF